MTSIRFDSEEEFDNAFAKLFEEHNTADVSNRLILQSRFTPRLGNLREQAFTIALTAPEDYEEEYEDDEYEIEYPDDE